MKNKKIIFFLSIIILIVAILVLDGILTSFKNKSVKEEVVVNEELKKDDIIKVTNLISNQIIKSPVVVEGEARGPWFFEASFPVRIIDDNGNLLGNGIAQAKSDWMTENFVPFKAEIKFTKPSTEKGAIILEKDNPSDLPQNADQFEIPVKFDLASFQETLIVKVYFGNAKLAETGYPDCQAVFSVEREVLKTQALARAALEELLKGPTDTEKADNYFTNINQGVKIQSLTIENGTAKVDFDEQLEYQVGGSCRVAAIRAQINQTLKQFSTVQNVLISINGRTEDILQP